MEQSEDQITFGHHVVALVDFVGQSSALAKWDFLPDSPAAMGKFVDAARDTYGRIMAWRDLFERTFALWLPESGPQEWATQTPDGGASLREFQETSIEFSHFSDTIVVHSPLENAHGHLSLHGTCAFIFTCGNLMLASLSQGSVFRGAIEVGMAVRFPEADLYGPALAKAHYLKSKVADYPRIVIGPSLIEYLHAHASNAEKSGIACANRSMANLCLGLLARDTDDCWIVDYMSDEFARLDTNREGLEVLRTAALEFVEAELARFQAADDRVLIDRYKRLAAYFRTRRPESGG